MNTLTFPVSDDMLVRFQDVCHAVHKPQNVLLQEALERYVEDYEDYKVASERSAEGGPTISLEEMVKRCGLENQIQ